MPEIMSVIVSQTRRTRLLVFLDSHVEVTKGWLEALIRPILKGEFIFSKRKCHSLYAQQKTAETITNKTTKTFVKKSSLTKILIDWGGLFMISISKIMVSL